MVYLNLTGIAFGAIGFLLMLSFNPAMKMNKEHIDTLIKTGESALTIPSGGREEGIQARREQRLHQGGMVLVMLGFVVQFISSLPGAFGAQ